MVADVAELRRALQGDQLVPHFQPIVELLCGRICGFEVLARWEHPEEGAILPPNLISLAEEHGLIGALSEQVFTKAFKAAAEMAEIPTLALNISPLQLTNVDLAVSIRGWADACAFPLDHLTLELTESALPHDMDKARTILEGFKALGCQLALDDFGTGYSSLAHLQSMPFDQLKIDRSFVARMTQKRESRKIVAAIIGLSHSLDMEPVAEGVETEAQADMLVCLGCKLGQGWLYGKPCPGSEVSALQQAPVSWVAMAHGPGEDWAVSSLEALPMQRLAQLQAIYDGAPVGLCFLDCKLRYVSLNKRLAELNGNTVAAHLGRTVAEMLPEMTALFEPYLNRALAGESISGVEFTRPGVDGRPGWASLVSYQPAFDEADEVIGISISVVDITEQKRAQEALHESEYVQQHMGELNRQIPWVMDAEGNNLQISSQWVKNVPAVKDRARNLGWLEAVHVDDLEHTWLCMKDALRTGRAIDVEYRIEAVDGQWRWMRSRGSPRFGENGEIKRWYGSLEDIHESKIAETEMKQSHAKLRATVESIPVSFVVEQTLEALEVPVGLEPPHAAAKQPSTPSIDGE
jgi:PAS domain S-box-containing protein